MNEKLDSEPCGETACKALLRHIDVLDDKVLETWQEDEAKTCIRILTVLAIMQLTSDDSQIAEESYSLLKKCFAGDKPEAIIVTDTMRYLREDGIKSTDSNICIEVMTLLPSLYNKHIQVFKM